MVSLIAASFLDPLFVPRTTRRFAEEWTYRFLAASLSDATEPPPGA